MARITTAHVDGACDQLKTKAGGWAVILNHGERVLSGGLRDTTNNIAELTAIRVALTSTTGPLDIRSDSEWSVKAVTGEYKIKENVELVEDIRALMVGRSVTLTWIPRNSEPSHKRADGVAKRRKEEAIADLNKPIENPAPVGLDTDSI